MTIHHLQLPHSEAARSLLAAPSALPAETAVPLTAPTTIATPEPGPKDEFIRHILIGSPEGVRETIYLLQARRYVDHAQWSGLIAIGEDGIRITRREGQVLAYLMRRRSLDIPKG